MNRKQLIALFIANTMPLLIGNALLPLLPVYIQQMGGGTGTAGLYLGLAFGTLSVGTLISGWLTNRFQRRKPFIILSGAVMLPALLLMSAVHTLWLLSLLTMLVWFMGGIALGTINILAGMCAAPQERGRIFGILATTAGIAQITGGLLGGRIVDHWGFPALFVTLALTQIILVVAGLLLEDQPRNCVFQPAHKRSVPVGRAIGLVLIASVLTSTLVFSSNLGLSVSMNRLGFNATSISSTTALAGVVTLPLPFIIGWLSDRHDRKILLAGIYAAAFLAALILMNASALWHFGVIQILIATTGASLSVGSALIADLAHPEALGTALSRFTATRWLGGVVGYMGSGVVMQALGFESAFLVGAALPLIAIFLTLTTSPHRPLGTSINAA